MIVLFSGTIYEHSQNLLYHSKILRKIYYCLLYIVYFLFLAGIVVIWSFWWFTLFAQTWRNKLKQTNVKKVEIQKKENMWKFLNLYNSASRSKSLFATVFRLKKILKLSN